MTWFFVLASGLSWADIALYNFAEDLMVDLGITFDNDLTKLAAIKNRVKHEPRIAKWVAERPKTPF